MIENQQQYELTKKWAIEFENAYQLALNTDLQEGENIITRDAMVQSLKNQAADLRKDIKEYESKNPLYNENS